MRWTNQEIVRQKTKWFFDAFFLSLIGIVFFAGFLWIATGCGGSGGVVSSKDEPLLAVGITGDELAPAEPSAQKSIYISAMGFKSEIPLEALSSALRCYKQCATLVPAKFRLAIDLVGLLFGVIPK